MEQTKKTPEMPSKQKSEISGGPKTTVRPEIDLPLKGGRSESDLSPNRPNQGEKGTTQRSDKSLR